MKHFATLFTTAAALVTAALAAPRDAPVCPADTRTIAQAFVPNHDFTAFDEGHDPHNTRNLVEVRMMNNHHSDGWNQQGIHLWNSLPEAVVVEVYHNEPRRGVNHPGALIGSARVPAAPNAQRGGTQDYWFPTQIATNAAVLFVFRMVYEHCG
ncbi:Hypothetical protein D9617_136g026540 [Elsinoe fawcettii]|nr:Hypothetical protein D9617_136g026540 [Elsinoe fawcettii]